MKAMVSETKIYSVNFKKSIDAAAKRDSRQPPSVCSPSRAWQLLPYPDKKIKQFLVAVADM